jgi:hypothetical protein
VEEKDGPIVVILHVKFKRPLIILHFPIFENSIVLGNPFRIAEAVPVSCSSKEIFSIV